MEKIARERTSKAIEKIFLRPAEVEEVYGIPEGSLANLRYRKVGPRFFKAGLRRVVYKVADIEEWISQGVVVTSQE